MMEHQTDKTYDEIEDADDDAMAMYLLCGMVGGVLVSLVFPYSLGEGMVWGAMAGLLVFLMKTEVLNQE